MRCCRNHIDMILIDMAQLVWQSRVTFTSGEYGPVADWTSVPLGPRWSVKANSGILKSVGNTSRRHRFDTSEMRFRVRSSLSVSARLGSWRSLVEEGAGESRNSRISSCNSSGKLLRSAMLVAARLCLIRVSIRQRVWFRCRRCRSFDCGACQISTPNPNIPCHDIHIHVHICNTKRENQDVTDTNELELDA